MTAPLPLPADPRPIQTCYVKRNGEWVWAGYRRKPVVVTLTARLAAPFPLAKPGVP